MLNPRKTNVALDANALDRNGSERDALVDLQRCRRFWNSAGCRARWCTQ